MLKVWLGGKGIGREGMLVREGSRVVWIEKTQGKTMVCGVKEGSDMHHVSFSSPLTFTQTLPRSNLKPKKVTFEFKNIYFYF